MNDAYLEYNELTGTILGVHWKKPNGVSIEIGPEIAISFMDGTSKIHLYQVVTDKNGEPTLTVIKDEPFIPVFQDQIPDDISENIKIKINKSSVTVTLMKEFSQPIGFYVTLKHDPSWLVNSFNLTKMSADSMKNVLKIPISNANMYSYHVGIINET